MDTFDSDEIGRFENFNSDYICDIDDELVQCMNCQKLKYHVTDGYCNKCSEYYSYKFDTTNCIKQNLICQYCSKTIITIADVDDNCFWDYEKYHKKCWTNMKKHDVAVKIRVKPKKPYISAMKKMFNDFLYIISNSDPITTENINEIFRR